MNLFGRTAKDRLLVLARRASTSLLIALLALSTYSSYVTFGPALAMRAGASRWEAALWPLVITATLVQAAFLLVMLAGATRVPDVRSARWYLSAVLVGGVIVSAAGNGYHFTHLAPGPLPIYVVVLVIAIPTLCLPISVGAYTKWAEARIYRH